jgi:hypothetical protein
MSLKRYLFTCYLITVVLLALAALTLAASDDDAPWQGLLIMAPVIGLGNVFVNIWPWARRVPIERRTSFWSYRTTNTFLGVVGGLMIVSAGLMFAA